MNKPRCTWITDKSSDLDITYHDSEWGVPVHEDKKLFEFLILEGAQAGLSWSTVLKKRENYRNAFDTFDYIRIAKYTQADRDRLMADAGIIRNRLKINAAIVNAQAFLEVQKEFGSFNKYIWSFTGGKTLDNHLKPTDALPATSKESDAMSKDLKKRGFKFVGSTICYAYMQAVGMVNDHLTNCFRYK
jgi:DNA-3-methyladenine glycosylase I